MPKKTKKQKRLAKKRRTKMYTTGNPAHTQQTNAPTYTLKQTKPVLKEKALIESQELALIKKDITKSVLLAALAILFELGLYYSMR